MASFLLRFLHEIHQEVGSARYAPSNGVFGVVVFSGHWNESTILNATIRSRHRLKNDFLDVLMTTFAMNHAVGTPTLSSVSILLFSNEYKKDHSAMVHPVTRSTIQRFCSKST